MASTSVHRRSRRRDAQAAKDYADAIEVPEVDLDDYYTKGEVDASQQAQDELASELAETVAIISGKVDQNVIDIDALENPMSSTWVIWVM